MAERRGHSRFCRVSKEEIRTMFFLCNRRALVVQAYIWWYDEPPPADIVDSFMRDMDSKNIPVVYERFLHKEIRPALLIVNNNPLPLRDTEILHGVDAAIACMKRTF